jgi:hypothetical protein
MPRGIVLPHHPSDRSYQFLDLVSLLNHVSSGKRTGDAMGYVIPQNLLFNLVESSPDRIDLRQDVHAIAILIHHPQQATDLPFDPSEP